MNPGRVSLVAACSWLLAAIAAAGDPVVELAGTLEFPGAVADGGRIGGLSGLTRLAGDAWVAAMDNSDRLVAFRLELSAAAVPTAVHDPRVVMLRERHDYEDVALCPPAVADAIVQAASASAGLGPGPWVLLCEEDTPAIHLAAVPSGEILSRVPLPAILASRRPNRGLESLAIDADRGRVWTATEEALATDGPAATPGAGTVARLVCVSFKRGARPATTSQFAYRVDPPHRHVPLRTAAPLSGVVALAALEDGRLLVLERSAAVGVPPFENRIYVADTTHADDVTAVGRDLAAWQGRAVAKRLLWRGELGCNLEGLAIGPELPAGGFALVAIADGGDPGVPGRIVGFRLTSP
jgi:hypothetical protein